VKFTFDRAKDPASASLVGSAFLSDVAAAQVIDSFTVRFSYARPHAQALEDFWWAPMPEHLLRDIPSAEMRNAPFNRQPVGSGPFRFVEWRANERLVLERNDSFADGLGGAPAAARIVFRVVPEASTLLTELLTGNVHIDIPLGPDQVEQVRRDDQVKVFSFPGRTVYYIGWNDARPPFDDPAVRRGLAMAIDRRTIIDGLLHGEGAVATSTIPPWHPAYPGDVEPLAFSIEAAGRTLDAAGWTDSDGDGIRENAGGTPLRFTLLASDDVLRRSVAEVLQSQLRQVGVDAQVRLTEFQTMIAAHRGRDFDAVFTNWVLDNFQVASSPFSLFHSSQADVAGSSNRSSVKIPALDRLIDQGRAATDLADQRRIWREFTEVLQREQPVTFMFWLNELAAVRLPVDGVEMDPRGELLTMARWSLRER
jgi:peptide/nickel transport system substrate-binding protein